MEQYKMDGVYFRICRDGEWQNICFSDMTKEERDQMMTNRSEEWLKSLCQILGDTLYRHGQDLFGVLDRIESRFDLDESSDDRSE